MARMTKNGYRLTTSVAGKVAIITGANSGIGRIAAIELAKNGANVILACRSASKTEPVVQEIRELTKREDSAVFWELDLSSLASVRSFAERFLASQQPLHLLINNGGFSGSAPVTADGFEPHFQVNYLSHFLLTHLLLPVLRQSAPSRILNVSSRAHLNLTALRPQHWKNYSRTSMFDQLALYAQSKFLQVVFTVKLAEELKDSGVTVFSLHPGVVATNVWREVSAPLRFIISWVFWFITEEEGATTTLYCATSPDVLEHNGAYYDQCILTDMNPLAKDPAIIEEVWTKSKELVGL